MTKVFQFILTLSALFFLGSVLHAQDTSVAVKLKQLQDLKDQNLITDAEYEETKARLLEDFLSSGKSPETPSNPARANQRPSSDTATTSDASLGEYGFQNGGRPQGRLLGKGATFPYPLYYNWFKYYRETTGIVIGYAAEGSGAGIQALTKREVDFGATDAYMSDEALAGVEAEIIHFPTAIGAVVITYNLPGNPSLKFSPSVLSRIYLGEIRRWNDPEIAALNSNARLPDLPITPVHRSDSSGTTFIFTDYLSKVSSAFASQVGASKLPNWPSGVGADGNRGVSELLDSRPGTLGYVQLTYAIKGKLPVAQIQNRAGNFVVPTLASVTAAANIEIPWDTRVSITDTMAPEGYPISSFTWVICYKEQNYDGRTLEQAQQLRKLFRWMVRQGQIFNSKLLYAPLSEEAAIKAENIINTMTFDRRLLILY